MTTLREFLLDSRSLRVIRMLPAVALCAMWLFSLGDRAVVASPLIYVVVSVVSVPLDSLGVALLFGQTVAFGTVLALAFSSLFVLIMIELDRLGFYLLCGALALLLEPVLNSPSPLGAGVFLIVFLTIENVVMPLIPVLTGVPAALATDTVAALWQGSEAPFASASASSASCYAVVALAYILLPPVQAYLRITPALLHRAFHSVADLLRLVAGAFRALPSPAADRLTARNRLAAGCRALATLLLPALPLAASVAQLEPPLYPLGARALPVQPITRIQLLLYRMISALSACVAVDLDMVAHASIAAESSAVEQTDSDLSAHLQQRLDADVAEAVERRSMLPCLRRRSAVSHSSSSASASVAADPFSVEMQEVSKATLDPAVLECIALGADLLESTADVLDTFARGAGQGAGGFVADRVLAAELTATLDESTLFAEHDRCSKALRERLRQTLLQTELQGDSPQLQRNLAAGFHLVALVASVCSRTLLDPMREQVEALVRRRVQPSAAGVFTTLTSPFLAVFVVLLKSYFALPKRNWYRWLRGGQAALWLRWVLGLAVLFALMLWSDGFQSLVSSKLNRTGTWAVTGLTAVLVRDVEVCIKKSVMRAAATLAGAFLGFGLLVLGGDNTWLLTIWVVLFSAPIIWLVPCGAPPSRFSIGWFDMPYLYQSFLMTLLVVFVDSSAATTTEQQLELTLSRLVAQLIGIGLGMTLTCVVAPHSAFASSRRTVRRALRRCAGALAEMPLVCFGGEDALQAQVDNDAQQQSVADELDEALQRQLQVGITFVGDGERSVARLSHQHLGGHTAAAAGDAVALAGDMRRSVLQLEEARKATHAADLFAQSLFCTRLPLIGSDDPGQRWLAFGGALSHILLVAFSTVALEQDPAEGGGAAQLVRPSRAEGAEALRATSQELCVLGQRVLLLGVDQVVERGAYPRFYRRLFCCRGPSSVDLDTMADALRQMAPLENRLRMQYLEFIHGLLSNAADAQALDMLDLRKVVSVVTHALLLRALLMPYFRLLEGED